MQSPKTVDSHPRASKIVGSLNGMHYLEPNFQSKLTLKKLQGQSSDNQIQLYQDNFHTQIQISSFLAWICLFMSHISSAFVPCWLMGDVKSQSFTRNSWRFFTLTILLIPFMLYQQRNLKRQQQKLINILTKENLKLIFISTINYCLWLLCLIYACKFTSMNHAICLSGLKFFVISFIKLKNGQKYHQFQVGGTMLVFIGVLLVLTDSIALPQNFDSTAQLYMRNQPIKRLILGDGLALIASVVSYYLDQNMVIPQMPRFTYFFVYNMFLCFCLITFGYFFGGNQFSFNIKFGIFGLFTYQNFVSVFYVSIMLGLNLILANIMVAQIFSQLMVNIATCFQLVITTMIYHILSLQLIPSGLTCLGYSFIIPGLIVVITGQGALNNVENNINLQLYRPSNRLSIKNKSQKLSLIKQPSNNSPQAQRAQNVSFTSLNIKRTQNNVIQQISQENELKQQQIELKQNVK